jgi:predicted  nucleic acid-binding Zn-ribbon protein
MTENSVPAIPELTVDFQKDLTVPQLTKEVKSLRQWIGQVFMLLRDKEEELHNYSALQAAMASMQLEHKTMVDKVAHLTNKVVSLEEYINSIGGQDAHQ